MAGLLSLEDPKMTGHLASQTLHDEWPVDSEGETTPCQSHKFTPSVRSMNPAPPASELPIPHSPGDPDAGRQRRNSVLEKSAPAWIQQTTTRQDSCELTDLASAAAGLPSTGAQVAKERGRTTRLKRRMICHQTLLKRQESVLSPNSYWTLIRRTLCNVLSTATSAYPKATTYQASLFPCLECAKAAKINNISWDDSGILDQPSDEFVVYTDGSKLNPATSAVTPIVGTVPPEVLPFKTQGPAGAGAAFRCQGAWERSAMALDPMDNNVAKLHAISLALQEFADKCFQNDYRLLAIATDSKVLCAIAFVIMANRRGQ
ncbi:hypothetical protein BAUCODRAFT_365959 [Baudoinia panamericana UAMH 10762]|uniref:RNase H type-1 domain-containing protein n=1 Tax=Baudoinia panamericana (strain UAMH 10762) TaxID=717646 RepID=M2LZL0_BAUPA|nr:uncharacterized protein BAUCODRAFT_365959 [Baudoinia panamericana UAMH 10762]EMD00133.1 hypothetical protein BAUCODRAFT_365959 [Baudoinia panamericana UAMH 10762]